MSGRFMRTSSRMIIVVVMVLASLVCAQENQSENVALSLLKDGMQQYQKGEYEEATETFKELMELKPDSQVALDMRRQAELKLLMEMTQVDDEALASVAGQLLDMMTEAVRQRKKEVEDPEKIRTGLQSPDLDTYLDARGQALGYGPYVIPDLLPLLTGKGADAQKTVARTMSTLVSIGRRATLPLLTVLKAEDKMLRVRAANVLGQVGDARAVPALLMMWEGENSTEGERKTASEAVKNITGQKAGELGSARSRYIELIQAYLEDNREVVGYVFGTWAEVWKWSANTESLSERLTYEEVPEFLYHQRQGAEFAVQVLASESGCREIQSQLVATMGRELEMARLYEERGDNDDLVQYAGNRVEELEKRIPMITHLYSVPAIGSALTHVMGVDDAAASFYVVKRLGEKVDLTKSAGIEALTRATHFNGKDARYRAAVELIKASPMGRVPEPDHVMQVIAAALRQAVQRTALVVSNNLQMRNELRTILKEENVVAAECDADTAAINDSLSVNPGVDVVFVYGNVPLQVFDSVYRKITKDGRTEGKPLYVVKKSDEDMPDLADYEAVEQVISTDSLRPKPISRLLKSAYEKSTVLSSPDAADLVLQAARTLNLVPP
ncbi:MAG: hypothetical protein ACOC0A_05700, partial [Planctomycetota bacterium]